MQVNTRSMRALLVVSLLLIPDAVRASSWYAQFFGGSRVAQCIHWPETIDESWAALNKQWGVDCELVSKDGAAVFGYRFRCGPDNNQFAFRTRENCESFKTTLNTGKQLNIEDYIPRVAKNRGGWVAGFDSCFHSAATPDNLRTVGLQNITDYCVCVSNETSQHKDDALTREIVAAALEKCIAQLGGSVPKPLLSFVSKVISRAGNIARENAELKKEIQRKKPSAVTKIVRGLSYSEVQERLKDYAAPKRLTSENYLWLKYEVPALLMYPDAKGECSLTFEKGKLSSCSGCNVEMFGCN